MCKFKDTTLGIKKLDFNVKRGAMAAYLTDGREIIVPVSMFPDVSTIEDAKRVRQQQGLNAGVRETKHMIRTWKDRGYCAQSTEHSFIKSVKYKKR